MPVVRNPQFYFREGLCWSDINTTFLKCRRKQKSINDVKSMSIFSVCDKIPENYIMTIINSSFISRYVDDFINNTQTFQINDARQLPIIIPTQEKIKEICNLADEAVNCKRTNCQDEKYFDELQAKVDKIVEELYLK